MKNSSLNLSFELTVIGNVLGNVTGGNELTVLSHFSVFFTSVLGETPLLGDDDLLTTGELHLSTTESFDGDLLLVILATNGDDRLANAHTSNKTVGLTVGMTHTGLESIGAGTGKHLVDTSDMEGMATNSHVEGILTTVLDEVLVSSNTSSFKSFRGKLHSYTAK